MNEPPLRLLCLEDNANDIQVMKQALLSQGLVTEFTVVRTQKDYLRQLELGEYDLILSDFTIPGYNGMAALKKAKELRPETPFIFVSGTIGEERAVEGLKSGATDYVLKEHLERLGQVILRAVREAREHRSRLQAEASLRESEARFRQVAENIDEVFRLIDLSNHQVLYINPAYEKVWQRTCESLYQDPQSWFTAVHPEDRERVIAAAATMHTKGSYDETYRIIRPDGSIRWVRDRVYPVPHDREKNDRVVGTAEDITERQELEERLLHSQKMECIGQLASGVAHNFNNVLAVIRANAELILMRSGSLESEYCKCLRQITSASDRAANLTRQMLTLSRKQTVQLRPLDLQTLVRELAKMLQGVVGANIEVLYTNAVEGAFVMADRSMLEQTVLNLAINARDAMPDGGQLRIGVEKVCPPQTGRAAHLKLRTGQFYCLKVSDTGTGINSEDLPHIFEPFFTTKEPGKGTGLGLSTVYGIVKQHEGWVEVASRVGEGTTFDIILPAIPAPAPPMEPTEQARDTRTIGVELACALNPLPPNPAISSLTLPQLSSNR